MPIEALQGSYLNCPVCWREFGPPPRSPITFNCGHTLCQHCVKYLQKKQCPFDQSIITLNHEEMVVNTALLKLTGLTPPPSPYHPPCIRTLPDRDRYAYDAIVKCIEHLAAYLKNPENNAKTGTSSNRLSKPMQRKFVALLQCTFTDDEVKGKLAKAARCIGERTVTELILRHQNPLQITSILWAAVRARGCQFLGPAVQEEVLRLVLLALENGSALSRKVLVMFVVQRLERHFPQASKTSIGHVVQLLYRASCFKVLKRESDSSLMQLKREFRAYEPLRREHDVQIVQIAMEAGLRITPDQWSALLYGDAAHSSHMQSIIGKLQSPQSFPQSLQELYLVLKRTGDPLNLIDKCSALEKLASIDISSEREDPCFQELAEIMRALKEVADNFLHYLQPHNLYDRESLINQNHAVQEQWAENCYSAMLPWSVRSPSESVNMPSPRCMESPTTTNYSCSKTSTYSYNDDHRESGKNFNVRNDILQSAPRYVVLEEDCDNVKGYVAVLSEDDLPPSSGVTKLNTRDANPCTLPEVILHYSRNVNQPVLSFGEPPVVIPNSQNFWGPNPSNRSCAAELAVSGLVNLDNSPNTQSQGSYIAEQPKPDLYFGEPPTARPDEESFWDPNPSNLSRAAQLPVSGHMNLNTSTNTQSPGSYMAEQPKPDLNFGERPTLRVTPDEYNFRGPTASSSVNNMNAARSPISELVNLHMSTNTWTPNGYMPVDPRGRAFSIWAPFPFEMEILQHRYRLLQEKRLNKEK